jgi:hypothetical protein
MRGDTPDDPVTTSTPPRMDTISDAANALSDLANAMANGGGATHLEVVTAMVHATANLLAHNPDPDQRARFTAAYIQSLPELVTKYVKRLQH